MMDYIILALRNVRKKGLRSWLTVLGIVIGVTAVVALLSIGQGFQKAIKDQFSLLGGDVIFVQPRGQFGPPGSSTVGAELTMRDVKAIDSIPGVKEVSYFIGGNAKLNFHRETRFHLIGGIPLDRARVLEGIYKIEEGRFLRQGDRRKVIIGSSYKRAEIFGRGIALRDTLSVNEEQFQVIGILKQIGNPEDDTILFISEGDMHELFAAGDRVDNILIKIEGDTRAVSDRIERVLRERRNVKVGNEDFYLLTPEELLKTFQNIFGIVQGFFIGIAAISLLVGGIGIMNTMYTSVLERTREIGIMKAIGAQRKDVLLIFLIESGMLGFVGGMIGIFIGGGLALLAEYFVSTLFHTTLLQATFPLYLIFGMLLFSLLIGAISGTLPALQASALKPVEALRYE